MVQDNTFDDETKEQLKQLVLERINVMPETLRIAVGSLELTKQEVAKHVRAEDEVGKQMIEMELEFLRALASGAIYAGT
ncbi:MAG: hypothetical protein Q8Q13_00195 [bacterium]|nr:hypothetical protein [bacterium]